MSEGLPHAPHVDEFLNTPEPSYDWLVPDIIERGDRVLLTGPEGGGKSTLLRQLALQAAAGVHPFTHRPIEPLDVLLVDLENSKRHLKRELRPLRQLVPQLEPERLRIVSRGSGIDLCRQDDREMVRQRIDVERPDLVIIGPLYKMAGGDPTAEEPARAVAAALDWLRMTYGFALLIEAHTPHGTNGGARPHRPYGASLWLRWPEFGLHLSPNGTLSHWRGARDERKWPGALTREGPWPWNPSTSAADLVWAQIVDHCQASLTKPSQRELSGALSVPKTTIARSIEAHRSEWNDLTKGLAA